MLLTDSTHRALCVSTLPEALLWQVLIIGITTTPISMILIGDGDGVTGTAGIALTIPGVAAGIPRGTAGAGMVRVGTVAGMAAGITAGHGIPVVTMADSGLAVAEAGAVIAVLSAIVVETACWLAVAPVATEVLA